MVWFDLVFGMVTSTWRQTTGKTPGRIPPEAELDWHGLLLQTAGSYGHLGMGDSLWRVGCEGPAFQELLRRGEKSPMPGDFWPSSGSQIAGV